MKINAVLILFTMILFGLPANAAAQTCTPAPVGLTAWYPGDGNAFDVRGGNNGALQGGATYATGKVGQAFSLNGTDAFVQAPSSPANDPTSAGSLEAWVYFNQTPNVAGRVMEIIGKGASGADFDLQAEPDNRFRFYVAGGFQVASNTIIQANTWYHVAGTWDSAVGLRIYVNGVLENAVNVQISRSASGLPLQIGNQPTFGPRLFSGLIDEASVYNRAVSDSEIQSIYNAGPAGKCRSTAAAVSVSGRILTADNYGIGNVRITLTNSNGEIRSALSGSFGYYQFNDVPIGDTYTLSVSAKSYSFDNPTRVLSVYDNASGVDFIALP